MADVLYNPESKNIEPLMKAVSGAGGTMINGVVYALENQGHVRQCCKIIRDICAVRGIPEASVPVIHRRLGRFRYWNITQGNAGASNFCQELLGTEWRIATAEEQKAQHADWEAGRAAALETAKRTAAARVVSEAGIKEIIEASVRVPVPQQVAPIPADAGDGKKGGRK